ncbi:fungal-specific transcription factor domain-containing protein [Halenospora varia]|nr:fungal-specific transcription factor domain-containing protein [Halenospora varia]
MNRLKPPKCRPAATAPPPPPSEYTSVPRQTDQPSQKRKRITRACDECRQRKVKCDGQYPCEHCRNYGYDCSYDGPSYRKKNPTQESVEKLKSKLSRMQTLVAAILPDIDVNSPTLDDCELAPATSTGRHVHETQTNFGTAPQSFQSNASNKDNPLETILGVAGHLDLDEHGNWDYHGHSSGSAFLRRLGKHFDNLNVSLLKLQSAPQFSEQAGVSEEYCFGGYSHGLTPLPPKNIARELVSSALDDACALLNFVHQPSFYHMFDRIYNIEVKDYGRKEHEFLPLLYASLAVGCLFSKNELAKSGNVLSTSQATRYFIVCRQMLNVMECRNLSSLQALIFMITFLQSSSKMSTCHSYIVSALASSLQMGLHRCDTQIFDPVEREIRKRIFWTIRSMETYVVAILGLPRTISDEDIDQEMPSEVDDEYITQEGVLLMPDGQISAITAFNAHTKLLLILAKIVRRVYPTRRAETATNGISSAFIVSDTNIRDVERDLDNWVANLPSQLRPCAESSQNHTRTQYLLRMTLMHVQMVLYRPFLHYIVEVWKPRG